MSGSPCADYAVIVHLPDGVETRVCRENHIYSADVGPGQSVELEAWWAATSEPEIGCYIWCADGGHVPRQLPYAEIAHRQLQTLVRILAIHNLVTHCKGLNFCMDSLLGKSV